MTAYLSLPCHDGAVLRCYNRTCISVDDIIHELERVGLNLKYINIHEQHDQYDLDLLSTVNHVKFVLIFHCCHVQRSLQRDTQQILTQEGKVIIVGRTSLPNMDQFKCFKVSEKQILVRYIQQMIPESENGRYRTFQETLSKEINAQEPLNLRYNQDETRLKEPVYPQQARHEPTIKKTHPPNHISNESRQKERRYSRNKIEPKDLELSTEHDHCHLTTGFIDAETFEESNDDNRGTYILKSACFPQGSYLLPVDELKNILNNENSETREDILKQIITVTLTDVIRNSDYHGMLSLLDIDDCRMQNIVISKIETFQFESNLQIRRSKGQAILHASRFLFDICIRWSANHAAMGNLLPVMLDTIAILYLASCVSGVSQSTLLGDIQEFGQHCVQISEKMADEPVSLIEHSPEYSSLLFTLKEMFGNLKCVGQKISLLFMGNLRDILTSDANRVQLKKKFLQMTYLEQHALILTIINQIAIRPQRQFVSFLRELTIAKIEKIAKKTKHQPTVYPLLRLICKGIVHILCSGSSLTRMTSECQLELCNILNIFLDTTKIQFVVRQQLLGLIEPALFKESKEIVTNVVYLFQKNNYQSKDIRDKVSQHIVRKLSSVNFKIDGMLNEPKELGLKPCWASFAGTISDDKHVIIHVLVPTLHCIAGGSMSNYTHRANRGDTCKHLNTLDILKHLQDGQMHHNLIQLLAFQCRPLPLFYITDQSVVYYLHTHLIAKRQTFQWISNRELITMATDAVDAISYLHSNHVIHRNITSFAFCLRDRSVVLHDLSVARILEGNTGFLTDPDKSQLPVLWSARESILEDHYDTKTDVWMLGHFFYELFTHGCHPYTEVYGATTEQLLEYIVFQDLKPHKWMCIPREVHDIIVSCVATNPEERIDTKRIRKLFNIALITYKEGRSKRVSQIFEEDRKYPYLGKRRDLPETGLPNLFQQLRQNNAQDRHVLQRCYFNTRQSQRRPLHTLQITEADVRSPEQADVSEEPNWISVCEPVTLYCVEYLPHLDEKTCTELLQMLGTPVREESSSTLYQYQIKYTLKKSDKLLEVAYKRKFGDPNDAGYIVLVLKLVEFVGNMHRKNWILRDLCANNVYVTNSMKQVTVTCLGRMLRLSSLNVLDDCVVEKVKADRQRWLPIEVLQNGQYSKESDIYMMAMVIFEFFKAFEIHEEDVMARDLWCAPFAKTPKTELLKNLYDGETPEKPVYCPDWLYEILKKCWNRDRTRRPTTASISSDIRKILQSTTKEEDMDDTDIYDTPGSGEYDPLGRESEQASYTALNTNTQDLKEIVPFHCVNSESESECRNIQSIRQKNSLISGSDEELYSNHYQHTEAMSVNHQALSQAICLNEHKDHVIASLMSGNNTSQNLKTADSEEDGSGDSAYFVVDSPQFSGEVQSQSKKSINRSLRTGNILKQRSNLINSSEDKHNFAINGMTVKSKQKRKIRSRLKVRNNNKKDEVDFDSSGSSCYFEVSSPPPCNSHNPHQTNLSESRPPCYSHDPHQTNLSESRPPCNSHDPNQKNLSESRPPCYSEDKHETKPCENQYDINTETAEYKDFDSRSSLFFPPLSQSETYITPVFDV